jgi:hypothetical protein
VARTPAHVVVPPLLMSARAFRAPDLRRRTTALGRFGQYELVAQVPSGPPDRCYQAFSALPLDDEDRPIFLRVFDRTLLTESAVRELKALAAISASGVEPLLDFGAFEWAGYVESGLCPGASLAEITRVLEERREHLSWGQALAVFAEARTHLAAIHAAGVAHGGLGPKQVRIGLGLHACVHLCHGLHLEPRPGSAERDVMALGRAVLPLAAPPDQRALVSGLLDGADPSGFAVLADLIQQSEPRLAEVVVELLWPEADLDAPAAADRVLAACVTPPEIDALWSLVDEASAPPAADPL